ncbi:hypothetical protein [Candidatus Carsonella ruddii]|uniref:Uncharacterized protein n=1 Tax=Candidatus Carsonella ruddii (Diaphorina cf. continua) TaxID=2661587 RepID=A0A7R6VZ69_CARRU|nr:hypothetical protein [Candidatus Carsonella ruddii (Diaphorina cf. continua)]BCG49241.1 hypothetical protein CRDco_0230 [Candidatus Carsonella ruddii (Diaphorina cf. continua)]
MKNLFILKKIKNFFSFGKDSFYSFYNFFYKKKKIFFINYYHFKINNFSYLKMFIPISLIGFKKISLNEYLLRRIRLSIIEQKNIVFIKNHNLIDKLELFLIRKINKNKTIFVKNIWYKNRYFICKPYYNVLIKKYFFVNDKSNKNIKINRNFLRCLISKLY